MHLLFSRFIFRKRVNKQLSLLLVVMGLLSGCSNIHLVGTPVAVEPTVDMDKVYKIVTLVGDTPYREQLTAALTTQGFTVLSPAVEARPNHIQTTVLATQWGIRLEQASTNFHCIFTEHSEYNFTLTLFDRYTGQTVTTLKQRATDGPCTTVSPVFGSLAKALRASWPTTQTFSHPCYSSDMPLNRRETLIKAQQRLAMRCHGDT